MTANISTKDRNVMTFTFACMLLAVIILGITFRHNQGQQEILHSMDVILTKKANTLTPEEADFLAQDNQMGGGTEDEKVRPQNIATATSPTETGLSQQETPELKKHKKSQEQQALITQQQSEIKIKAPTESSEKKEQKKDDTKESPAQRLARIENELAKKLEKYAKKPRSKYISSNTKAYEYAPYISKWVKKIERTGDLNYPEQAKKANFQGSVMLSVGIKKDGTIHEIKVIKASPHQFLNEAAKHIVEMAQPFDPLPKTKERVDILYITRTWQFLPGHLLRHK
ncbi:energy transducer TonB [Marinicella rhabdoformis]|uniref:energy transducer TonB n=1 Tax=Marinicella rhabdoformis TaxID=2580566 RepID=UPI0012AEBA82|nr:TonB family protein [Marinicella rhabdoformis]